MQSQAAAKWWKGYWYKLKTCVEITNVPMCGFVAS